MRQLSSIESIVKVVHNELYLFVCHPDSSNHEHIEADEFYIRNLNNYLQLQNMFPTNSISTIIRPTSVGQ